MPKNSELPTHMGWSPQLHTVSVGRHGEKLPGRHTHLPAAGHHCTEDTEEKTMERFMREITQHKVLVLVVVQSKTFVLQLPPFDVNSFLSYL